MTKRNQNDQFTTDQHTIVGLFHNRNDAEIAIRDLKNAGFSDDQLGVAMQDRQEQRELMERTDTKAAEGATAGAVGGGVVGGVLGLLAGVGALTIPGIGPVVAAGWLGSTLAGAGIGAAAGGILGGLVGMGIPEEDVQHFESGFKQGGILVTVHARERESEALAILNRQHADLGPTRQRTMGSAAGTAGRAFAAGTSARAAESRRDLDEDPAGMMRLREEELRVEKERQKAGEVRVRKEVVTEQRSIDVPVSREEAVIERRPARGDASAGDIGEGKEIRVPLSEERVRVEKEPVVREEISVGKREVTESRHIDENVRREEARVEQQGDVTLTGKSGRSGKASSGKASSSKSRSRYTGPERRYHTDSSYTGPERRLATV